MDVKARKDLSQERWWKEAMLKIVVGRGERIRTSDHLAPSQVRYQAALRPEAANYSRAKKCMTQ